MWKIFFFIRDTNLRIQWNDVNYKIRKSIDSNQLCRITITMKSSNIIKHAQDTRFRVRDLEARR